MSDRQGPGPGEAATDSVEADGNSLEEAVETALARLGVSRAEAEVEVLSGAGGAPGMARVRAQVLDAHTARGRALLETLLELMGVSCRVTVRRQESPPMADQAPAGVLDVSGEELGLLIGWRGETLRAMQTILNLMLGGEGREERRLVVDVERYRARRENQVRELALRVADRVKRSGQRQTLDPMHGYERRMVHLALREDPGVRTESIGNPPSRRVVILPGPPR